MEIVHWLLLASVGNAWRHHGQRQQGVLRLHLPANKPCGDCDYGAWRESGVSTPTRYGHARLGGGSPT